MSRSGWYSNWIGPRRSQFTRSSETARAGLGPERAVGHVGHHVPAQVFDPGGAGVFHAGVVLAALPARVGGEDHAVVFDAGGHAVLDRHLGEPDAGDVALRDQARSRWSLPSGCSAGGRG